MSNFIYFLLILLGSLVSFSLCVLFNFCFILLSKKYPREVKR